MGAPFATLTSESCFISLEKTLLDEMLKITISSFMDLDRGYGELSAIETEYDFGNGLNTIFGISKIIGDDQVSNYIFNDLEDFSHMRFEVKYNF